MTVPDAGSPWSRVIVTKVRPPKRRRDLVSRARLHRLIGSNLDRKLLLVSAPAGYGKTSLLVDYASASGLPVCWYRLDGTDRDPVAFFEHLVGALRQRFPNVCPNTLGILSVQAASGSWAGDDVVAMLVNEMDEAIDTHFWLVLDDYQHIEDAARVNQALDGLLHYLPDNCQVVLSSRTVPRKLTLTRLAGAGQAAGIGVADLRFTTDEIRALMAGLGSRSVSDLDCERLEQRSEGWVTALVLGGRALLEGGPSAASGREALFAFLAHEVFERQTDDVRAFLTLSSALDDLCPELCDAALARTDSARMLEALDRENLFVSRLEGDEEWHRYHQLFRDFLRAQLPRLVDPDTLRSVHRRAASWLEHAGSMDAAIHHLVQAGDSGPAADRMHALSTAALSTGRWQTIVHWSEMVAPEAIRARPALVQRLGTALTYCGDLDGARAIYGWAVADAEASGDEHGLASALVRRSVLFRLLGRAGDARDDAQRAVALARAEGGPLAGRAHRAMGGALVLQGDLAGAKAELQAALAFFEPLEATASGANAHNDLAAVCLWTGDVDRAVHHSRQALDRWERLGNGPAAALSANNLGIALHQQGRYPEARAWFTRAIEASEASGYRRAAVVSRLSLGDLLRDLDDPEGAVAEYSRALALSPAAPDGAAHCYAYAARAEARRQLGDLAAARSDLSAAREALPAGDASMEAALVAHVSGTIALDEGEPSAALRHLGAAADGYASSGAHREAARSLLHAVAAARVTGDPETVEAWSARCREAVESLPYPHTLDRIQERLARRAVPRPGVVRARRSSPYRVVASADRSGPLEVCALGRPEVLVAGRAIAQRAWQSASARDIFFYLMAHPEGATPDRLMAAFWPEAREAPARNALHSATHRIRRALGRSESVEWDGDRYSVRWPGPIRYDVAEFRAWVARASAAVEDAARADALDRAIGWVRGEYLEGVLGEWCAPFRAELDVAVVEALLALGRARAHLGEHARAVEAFRRAVAAEPLREEAHRGLMRAYAALGDRAMALRQYEACARVLADELGAVPDTETITLRSQLLA